MIVLTFTDTDGHNIAASKSIKDFRMMLLNEEERYLFLQSLAMMEDWDPPEVQAFLSSAEGR